MNISIDDTSPNFVWSNGADDWRAQAPNQVSLNSQYFLQTYHASQSKGADVSITFVGAAIHIYGSRGPNHGNYSVTFDNTIKFFAGFSEQRQYQQLLFSRIFGTNTSETHTVQLTNEEDYWLDLDFVVLTVATAADTSTSDIGFFTSTIGPGTSVPPSSPSTDGSSPSSSSSEAPSIFRTLTFVLAGVLAFVLLSILAWFLVFRRRRSRYNGRGGSGGGRARGMSNSSSQQEFHHAQKNGSLSNLDASKTTGGGGDRSVLGFGRIKFGGKEDYARSPTSAGGGSISATEQSRYSRHDGIGGGGHQSQYGERGSGQHGGTGGNTTPNAAVSSAARETLIALNNMGKRPGYRTLAGDVDGGSRTSVVNAGSETPTSMRTIGSAAQLWLGATSTGGDGERESSVRFKGRTGRDSHNQLNGGGGVRTQRSSSHGSDLNLCSHSGGGRLENINDSKDEDPYVPSGIGLGVYAANIRSESDQQRMMDLKRSASVASSGILDRLTSSPPPAVPELPPSATTSNSNLSRMGGGMAPPPRSFSPAPTEGSTLYSHGGAHTGVGFATKVQYPYGRNNEVLVHSHSGSLNSSSGFSATTTVNNGLLPLRPPPIRGGGGGGVEEKEKERERALLRERERVEKEREAAAERTHQQERELQGKAEAPHSNPPPEYIPTPTASQTSMGIVSQLTMSGGAGLQRQGTRTGDIPIGIDAGYGYESESQDSHSVAHAYVSTAQHVNVPPPTLSQPPAVLRQQPPPPLQRPQHHGQRDGSMGSTGSSNLGLPPSGTTGTSTRRAITPDRGRSYDPGRAVAVASGARSNTPTGMSGVGGQPTRVGRNSEEKTWGLDGVHASDRTRQGLGRPIMDDRTRLAVSANQPDQKVPSPRD